MDIQTLKPVFTQVLGKKATAFKFDSKEYPVHYLKSEGEMLVFRTGLRDKPNYRNLIFHHNQRQFIVKCRLLASNEMVETIQPLEVKVEDSPRRHDRVVVFQRNFTIPTISTLGEIGEAVKLNTRPISSLRDAVEKQLKEKFLNAVVHIYSGGIVNSRLEALTESPRVIFYNKDRSEQKSQQYFSIQEFENKIFAKDRDITGEMNSEITVPILFKGHLVFGYVQVNSKSFLEEEIVRAIKKLAINLEYKIRKLQAPWEAEINGRIIDISLSGMSFEFANRDYARYFQVGKKVYLNMHLGEKNAAQALARVRHSDFVSGKNWVGISYENLDPISEVTLEESIAAVESSF